MPGRRYRSLYRSWSMPYVDDTRLVFVPESGAVNRAVTRFAVLLQIVACCVIALGVAVGPFADDLSAMGVIVSGVLPFAFYTASVPFAEAFSRLRLVRRRLVVEQVLDPLGQMAVQGSVDGQPIPPTTRRMLLHVNLLSQRRLLLILGDSVLELWQSPWYGGGGLVKRGNDWVVEHLADGEDSPRTTAPEEGGGGELLPVIENMRAVLSLSSADEARVQGPEFPTSAVPMLMLLAVIVSAGAAGVTIALGHLGTVVASPFVLATIGASTGVVLMICEWIILRRWLRAVAARWIDPFVAGVLTYGVTPASPDRRV